METERIIEIIDEGVLKILVLNRPKALNTINPDLLTALDGALDQLKQDDKLKTLIITGAGEKAFAAGADISSMIHMNPAEAKRFSERGHSITRKIEQLPCVTIAAINGYAFGGGCELALACDIRIASSNSSFSLPEVGIGVIPGFGGTQRLSRLVGKGFAKELILTGKRIGANWAQQIGLVNDVVEAGALLDACRKLAEMIGKNSRTATAFAKKAIDDGYELEFTESLSYEANYFSMVFTTEDQKEGMGAFIEKRKPVYK